MPIRVQEVKIPPHFIPFVSRHSATARQRLDRGVVLHAPEGPQEDQRQPLRRARRRHRVHERAQAVPLATPLAGREQLTAFTVVLNPA